MGRLKRSLHFRLRRYVVLGVIAVGIRARLRHRINTLGVTRPYIGIIIGLTAGIFVDRGLRESSIADNLLVGITFAAIFGLYDHVNGITIRIIEHGSNRIPLTLAFMGSIAIVSAIFNELTTARPSKLSPIAVAGAVIALILFSFSVQKVTVEETPVAKYDVGKLSGTRVRVNSTTLTVIGTTGSSVYVSGCNGTVTGTVYAIEQTGEEDRLQLLYVTIRDNDTGLHGGLYTFTVLLAGIDDGILHNEYYKNESIDVYLTVFDPAAYAIIRRLKVGKITPTVNATIIKLSFNATIAHDIASAANGKYRLRLDMGFNYTKARRDKVSVTVVYKLIKTTYPNINYINYAVASLALAVLAAVPEIPIRVKRRRRG